ALELHEHVVPDLDKPVAVFFRRSRWAAPDVFAVIVENFGTGTARAGIAHGPEVIGGVTGAFVVTDTNDLIGRHAHLFVPDVVGFVVFGVHRYHQLFSRQVQPLRRREEFPGKLNGVFFEVITKAEVAQHFKEGVVTRGITDVFQVIVLTTGTHTAL